MSGRVSVVTVYFNRQHLVAASIKSLLAQDYNDMEIIVVDDGSTDGTLEALEQFQDSRLRIIRLENGGFTQAIRAGIDASTGSLIAVHGSGDLSYKTRMTRQVAVFEQHKDVVVVGCHVKNALPGGRYHMFTPPNGLDFSKTLLKRNLFTHGEVMFRRDAYEKCGGYRTFFRYAQDLDLWLRMSALGNYHIVEDVLYERERQSDGVGSSHEKFLLQQKLVEFSRQCRESVLAGGTDLLDRHGPAGALLVRRSPRLAKSLSIAGASQMVNEDAERGWKLMTASLDEYKTPQNLAMCSVLWTHRFPGLFRHAVVPAIKTFRVDRRP